MTAIVDISFVYFSNHPPNEPNRTALSHGPVHHQNVERVCVKLSAEVALVSCSEGDFENLGAQIQEAG